MPTPRLSDRSFGLALAAVLGAIVALAWLSSGRLLLGALVVSGALASLALLAPGLLLPLNRFWGVLAGFMGRVTNLVVLGLFFYGLMLPAGLLARSLRADPANRHPRLRDGSFWRPVERRVNPDTLHDQF